MSDRPASFNQLPAPDEAAAVAGSKTGLPASPGLAATPFFATSNAWLVPRKWLLAVMLVAAGGLLASVMLWQKLNNIQEELARRSLDSGAQAIEARALAKAAQDATREVAARLALQEGRISEVSLQRGQLEELMRSLSRSRDENLVVDIESAVRLAQQQAQLTGSAEPLIAALVSADQRLQRAAQPRLNPLQRAIARDTDRIKAASLTDVPNLMLKIDELARMADELPMGNAMPGGSAAAPAGNTEGVRPPVAGASAPKTGEVSVLAMYDSAALNAWAQRLLGVVRDEARKLLRVSRIEQPEAALLSPEQAFFLRENFKLRLLNARLALLSRQTSSARADLQAASVWLAKYFDAASRKTQNASQLLQQVQSQVKTSELPRLDDTMTALATAAAGR